MENIEKKIKEITLECVKIKYGIDIPLDKLKIYKSNLLGYDYAINLYQLENLIKKEIENNGGIYKKRLDIENL